MSLDLQDLGPVLAADPGTKTGWAICADGQVLLHGQMDFSAMTDPDLMVKRMGVEFKRKVLALLIHYRIQIFAIEFQVSMSRPSDRLMHSMATELRSAVKECGLLVIEIAIQTLKKEFTGHGHADKKEIKDEVGRRFNLAMEEHEADAVAMAIIAPKMMKTARWNDAAKVFRQPSKTRRKAKARTGSDEKAVGGKPRKRGTRVRVVRDGPQQLSIL